MAPPTPPPPDPTAPLPNTTSWHEFNECYKRDNTDRVSASAINGFNQVVSRIQAFDAAFRISGLTRE